MALKLLLVIAALFIFCMAKVRVLPNMVTSLVLYSFKELLFLGFELNLQVSSANSNVNINQDHLPNSEVACMSSLLVTLYCSILCSNI